MMNEIFNEFTAVYIWYLHSLFIKPDNVTQYNGCLNVKEHTTTPFLSDEG